MPAYVIFQAEVLDPQRYAKYVEAANGTHGPFGGRFLVRGGKVGPLEGDWTPARFVVIQFPDADAAIAWYRSPAYQAARKLRLGAADLRGFIVDGIPDAAPRGRRSAVVNLAEKFAAFDDHWAPKRVATVDDYDVKLVKVKGEFTNHVHESEDELFLVLEGELGITMPDGEARLTAGELAVVPKGTPHKPSAARETKVLLLERRGVVNTGDRRNTQTRDVEAI